MRKSTIKSIKSHVLKEFPREGCGVVILENNKEVYVPCRNISPQAEETFVMSQDDYFAAEGRGEVVMVIHSHPNASANPSEGDRVSLEETQLPWGIVSVYKDLLTGAVVADDPLIIQPTGYEAPLVGRTWCPPTLDCFSLVRSYYSQELGITIPDFELQKRAGAWWEDPNNTSLYLDHYEEAGFVRVDGPPQKHDVIFMEIGTKAGPNHAGVYLGDETGYILHHLYGRLSERAIYGGYWLTHTRMTVRHKDLC